MKTAKILVTGGTGYIGSHTAISLLEQNFEVVIIDNLINSEAKVIDRIQAISGKRVTFLEVDMQDSKAVDELFLQQKDIEAVIHFAALKAVGESVAKPLKYYQNNLVALLNLLINMQRHQTSNLIFSSSATVYGEPDQLPIQEDAAIKPALSPYGNTKKISEDIIRDFASAQAWFKAISLRYFNPIGAHASGKIGELPNGTPNNLMPFITQTATGQRKELLVFGDDYNTPDGTAIRDYIHVMDLAEAHVKAVERLLGNNQDSNYEIINLGTGKGYSVLEVIQSFEKASGLKIPYSITNRRPGDVEQTYAATAKANQVLQWQALRSLDEMTASAWNWEQQLQKIRSTSTKIKN